MLESGTACSDGIANDLKKYVEKSSLEKKFDSRKKVSNNLHCKSY